MIDTTKYKKLLEEERKRLEEELAGVGEKNPSGSNDWTPTPPPNIEHEADPIDAADAIEEYAERVGIEIPLEERLKNVNEALAAIANGSYGICAVGGTPHPIEPERLEANPASITCVTHMNA